MIHIAAVLLSIECCHFLNQLRNRQLAHKIYLWFLYLKGNN